MKKKVLLISNMYPKNDKDFFGIFVKKFESGISNNFLVKKCVIQGNSNSFFVKMIDYFIFYFRVFLNCFFIYDVIYVHFPTRSSIPILLNPFFRKRLIILNYHGSDLTSSSKVNKISNFILTPLVIRSSLIVVPSEFLKNLFLRKYTNQKVYVSPSSGVPDFFYEPKMRNDVRKAVSFVFLSSLLENKGVLTLLNSLEQLISKGYEFHCSIYGNGPLLEIVKSYAYKHNDFISYNGALENNLIPKIYAEHDFFVFPSKNESLGLVGLEALACGLPVIGSRIPAIQSYLIDGFNGLLFESSDANDLADKIFELIYKKELLSLLRINSRLSVQQYQNSYINLNLINKINETIGNCRS